VGPAALLDSVPLTSTTPIEPEAAMARFLIEVAHDPEAIACARVVKIFLSSGSHFLTQADWGCMDGDHRSWIIVDVDDKHAAMAIVPPALRPAARIVGLNYFSLEQIDAILKNHPSSPASP
jgi:hypothetical protein